MTEARPHTGSTVVQALPDGVVLRALTERTDNAVGAVELFRTDWSIDAAPVQWNFVHSEANTLRGVHVHTKHWDYLCVLDGEMLLGLHDLRPTSPTHLRSTFQVLRGDRPSGISVPPGVAHGFYFAAAAKYVYGTSTYWSRDDEIGCMWNDPELRLDWPVGSPILSPRDSSAAGYMDMVQDLAKAMRRPPRDKAMTAPTFTILLPVNRPPALLKYAVRSVQAQERQDFELFIICDGAPPENGRLRL